MEKKLAILLKVEFDEGCSQHHATLDSLVQSVDAAWAAMSAEYIIKVCLRFQGHLEAIIEARGGHIED